jgi:Na+-transporting methylmalonyl-CoA/oxaloacetate decarboxylase gamma subunit
MRKDEPGPMSPAETPSERPPASGAEDPIASLFSADRTLPAPVVAPEVNESEMTRWKSARDSLFGDLVKDPPPSEPSVVGPPPSRTGRTLGGDHADDEPLKEKMPAAAAKPAASKPREEGRTSDSGTPLVRALSVAKIGQQHESGRDLTRPRLEEAAALAPPSGLPKLDAPLVSKKRTQLNAAPPPPAAGVAPPPPAAGKRGEPLGKKARPDVQPPGIRTRKKTPPVRPEPAVEASASARRRLRRGPKPLLLAALGLLVLAAGGVSAVVLEIVPDPFAEPSQPIARGAASSAKQVAAAAPAAAAPAAQPVVAAAAPAASKPAAAAPKGAVPKLAAAAAQPVAQQAKPAPVAAAAAPDDEATASAGANQLVGLARKALADENAAGAEALARRALAKGGEDHHAMEVLARALIDQDRGAEAVTFARRIVEKRRKRVPYRLLLGDALLMVGDTAGAQKEWQVAASLEPDNREVKQRLR